MKRDPGFDEVMIVNPHDPALGDAQGETLMQFHYAESPEFAYYAEPPEIGGWGEADGYGEPEYAEYEPVGYYAQADPYGYCAEPPEIGGWGEADVYGEPEFAEYEPVGYYGQADPYGYYAQPPEMGAWGEPEFAEYEPVGYFAEEYPVSGYGQVPELVGWGEYEPVGYYAEPEFAGYVRDTPPTYNPSCPMPTNVAGFGEYPLEGYVKPRDVSPTCEQFTPPAEITTAVPETFRPIW